MRKAILIFGLLCAQPALAEPGKNSQTLGYLVGGDVSGPEVEQTSVDIQASYRGAPVALHVSVQPSGDHQKLLVTWTVGNKEKRAIIVEENNLANFDLSGVKIYHSEASSSGYAITIPFGDPKFCFVNHDGRSSLEVNLSLNDVRSLVREFENCEMKYRYFTHEMVLGSGTVY